MNKFYQIPTDTFMPLSHDNSYLFSHYDKVANFLAFNLDKNYKNILAKPVQNGYMVDWFSIYENLTNINELSKDESVTELAKYWQFIDIINAKIIQLSLSTDENNKNWANLLTKVFNHNDNFIFSNGKDICIVWGWKFDNTTNYKPNISKTPNTFLNPDKNEAIENSSNIIEDNEVKPDDSLTKSILPNEIDKSYFEAKKEDDVISEELVEDDSVQESSFLKFLKWFASNFWWLLWLLLLLIIFFLLIRSCNCNDNYNDINNKLNQLEQKANDCIN